MRHSLKLNINWELLIDLHQLQKDKLDINTNVQFYNLLVLTFSVVKFLLVPLQFNKQTKVPSNIPFDTKL